MSTTTNHQHVQASGMTLPENNAAPASKGQTLEPEAIRTARAITAGKLPVPPGFDFPVDIEQLDEDWVPLLLYPQREVELLSEYGFKPLLSRRFPPTFHEERLSNVEEPCKEGCAFLRGTYQRATEEALEHLARVAKSDKNTYSSARLAARIAKALHEELAQLVGEWESVAPVGEAC